MPGGGPFCCMSGEETDEEAFAEAGNVSVVTSALSADGVPDTIHIDPSPSVADDEFDVRVSEFATIPD